MEQRTAFEKLHEEVKKSVNEAMRQGKAPYDIGVHWKKKEREHFLKEVDAYSGDIRETYCKLFGMTVQWIHSAGESQLNQVLHNLQLQTYVSKEEHEIRQRLLMFLRYG